MNKTIQIVALLVKIESLYRVKHHVSFEAVVVFAIVDISTIISDVHVFVNVIAVASIAIKIIDK